MVNGVPGRPILNNAGLRQGNPLSPVLFIMIMEPLQRMFELTSSRGCLDPLTRGGLAHRLSMFADDVVVFLKPSELDLCTCEALLNLFSEASGLHANLSKSVAFSIRCSADAMDLARLVLGYPSGSFPCK